MKNPRWLLLTHQLPAHPSNIRVKVWRKLQVLGAVPVKNSIYVLPNGPSTREDFDWLRKEILQMGGDATVFAGDAVSEVDGREIVRSFREARAADYARLIREAGELSEKIKGALEGGHVKPPVLERLEKDWGSHKADLERLRRVDFFKAANRAQAEAASAAVQKAFLKVKQLSEKGVPAPPPPAEARSLTGRVWVTRTSPHIDRLASAWLVRRFVDSAARFKFVTPPYEARSNELRFDMAEAEFTHFGDWCTFETLMHRLRLKDRALAQLAEIVHDIDLKDRKFSRPEASGVALAVRGLCRRHARDAARLEAGFGFFEGVYAALEAEAAA